MSEEHAPDGERAGESDAPDEVGEEGGEEGVERGKPLSIRDVMPSSPPRARPRSPGESEDGGEEEEETGEGRPTPVRIAMDAPPPGDSRPPEELPSRRFETGEEEWVVRVTGRSVAGARPDPGAPLMHLTFYRPEAPLCPEREVLTVERELELFYDEDLAELLQRSRPCAAE